MCLVEWHPTSPFVYRGALTDVCMHMYTCPLSAIRSRSFAPTAGPGQPLHQQQVLGNLCTNSMVIVLGQANVSLPLPSPSLSPSPPSSSPSPTLPPLSPPTPLPPPTTPSPPFIPHSLPLPLLPPPSLPPLYYLLLPPPPSLPPPLLPPPPFPSLSPPPSPPSPHIGAHGEVSLMDVGRRSVSGPHLLL